MSRPLERGKGAKPGTVLSERFVQIIESRASGLSGTPQESVIIIKNNNNNHAQMVENKAAHSRWTSSHVSDVQEASEIFSIQRTTHSKLWRNFLTLS